jgi:hypothetical protein
MMGSNIVIEQQQPLDSKKILSKKSTTTVTFRIDTDSIQIMKAKALQDGVTLNTLISHILRRYLEWDMFIESRVGIIPLTKPVTYELFKKLSKDEVVYLAQNVGKKAVCDIVLFMKGNLNQSTLIDWFLSRMRNSSSSITSKHADSIKGLKTYVIKHDMGENWSLYHKTIIESIFNDILKKPIVIDISESTILLQIKEDDRIEGSIYECSGT